jgi:hypothetical protein
MSTDKNVHQECTQGNAFFLMGYLVSLTQSVKKIATAAPDIPQKHKDPLEIKG